MAPLPCAYIPHEIAPLLDVKSIAKAMEHVIVDADDADEKKEQTPSTAGKPLLEATAQTDAQGQSEPVVVVKGLQDLVADIKAKEEQQHPQLTQSQTAAG